LNVEKTQNLKEVAKEILTKNQISGIKILVLIDSETKIESPDLLAWYIVNNIDPNKEELTKNRKEFIYNSLDKEGKNKFTQYLIMNTLAYSCLTNGILETLESINKPYQEIIKEKSRFYNIGENSIIDNLYSTVESKANTLKKDLYIKIDKLINEKDFNVLNKPGISPDILDYMDIDKLGYSYFKRDNNIYLDKKTSSLLYTFENYLVLNNDFPMEKSNIEDALNTKNIVNRKKDKRGNWIQKSGREVTKDEKINMFKYLEKHEYPPTNKTYRAIFNRVIYGNIELFPKEKETNIKTLKKTK
jgi:hypothetical protein